MRLAYIVLIIWCLLWINFTARDLWKKGRLSEYKLLVRRDAEEKHALTYGRRFYEFLKFSKTTMPKNARYEFAGITDFSLNSRRGIYYLYPAVKTENPEYVLAYGMPDYEKEGFELYAALDKDRFIFRKRIR